MKPFFGVTEDGMIVRYDPHVVINPDEILAKMNNRDFRTIFKYDSFLMPIHSASYINKQYKKVAFNFSITSKNSCIFWSFLPGLPFDSAFRISEVTPGKLGYTPCYERTHGDNAPSDIVSERLWWDVDSTNCVNSDFELRPLIAINIDHASQLSSVFLVFNIYNRKEKITLGNFLPPITNIFKDCRVCMGHTHNPSFADKELNVHDIVQGEIQWFFESKMNGDLAQDTIDRQGISNQLFRWDENKMCLPSPRPVQTIVNSRVGNYYIDGLPLDDKNVCDQIMSCKIFYI
jgi:hypothetical protein